MSSALVCRLGSGGFFTLAAGFAVNCGSFRLSNSVSHVALRPVIGGFIIPQILRSVGVFIAPIGGFVRPNLSRMCGSNCTSVLLVEKMPLILSVCYYPSPVLGQWSELPSIWLQSFHIALS